MYTQQWNPTFCLFMMLLNRLPAAATQREQALEDHDVLRRVHELLELSAALQVGDVRDDQGHEEVDEDQRSDEGEADEEEHGEDEWEGVFAVRSAGARFK